MADPIAAEHAGRKGTEPGKLYRARSGHRRWPMRSSGGIVTRQVPDRHDGEDDQRREDQHSDGGPGQSAWLTLRPMTEDVVQGAPPPRSGSHNDDNARAPVAASLAGSGYG